MTQYSDLVSLLRAVPLFAGLDPGKLKLLAFSSASLALADGEILICVGEPADAVYIIEAGDAEILIGDGDTGVRIGVFGKNWLVGELAVFLNEPRTATVRAIGELRVLRIDADVFLRIVSENPDVALNVMRILSDKLARMTESVERFEVGRGRPVSTGETCQDAALPPVRAT